MTFVNEYISEADLKKYNFAELYKRPRKGMDTATDWTINREANIWLRKFYTESDHTAPDGGFTGVSGWDFYWKGTLLTLEILDVGGGGGYGKHRWTRKRLLNLSIPPDLENQRVQIIKDLKEAFTVYRGVGVSSFPYDSPSYSFELEIQGDKCDQKERSTLKL